MTPPPRPRASGDDDQGERPDLAELPFTGPRLNDYAVAEIFVGARKRFPLGGAGAGIFAAEPFPMGKGCCGCGLGPGFAGERAWLGPHVTRARGAMDGGPEKFRKRCRAALMISKED